MITPFKKPMRILVTGGAGFIGAHLCERLLSDGHRVFCLDSYQTGRADNIRHLFADPAFEFILRDVSDPITLQVDQIYNLACPASPKHYLLDPVRTTKTAVLGTINLLDLAAQQGCRLLQASTSEIYGDPTQHPQSEPYWGHVNPIGPRACYNEGKRCAESLCFDYHRQYGLDVRVARIFNTYGPRMHSDDGRVVSNFVEQALAGEAITLFGGGSQTRSFCYVADMVEGLVALMNHAEAPTGPVNLGNPEEVSIEALARLVLDLTESVSQIAVHPAPVDDPRQRCPDISMAKALLGWAPKTPLEVGLRETIAYSKSTRSQVNPHQQIGERAVG